MTRLTPSIFTVALLVGCVGNRPLTTGDLCPCAPGWSCDLTTDMCVAGNSAVNDGSCSATCATPVNNVQPFTSVDQAYALVTGSWQICTLLTDWQAIGAPSDVVGVEFGSASGTNGGDAYYLVQGPSGLVRGSGFAYQLTYGVFQQGSQVFLWISPTPDSSVTANAGYSPCPTETALDLGSGHSFLVRL